MLLPAAGPPTEFFWLMAGPAAQGGGGGGEQRGKNKEEGKGKKEEEEWDGDEMGKDMQDKKIVMREAEAEVRDEVEVTVEGGSKGAE